MKYSIVYVVAPPAGAWIEITMPHKIYIKKIKRDYEVKPTIFERYVLWSMKLTEDWLFLFIIGLFLLSITLTMFVILGLLIAFGG